MDQFVNAHIAKISKISTEVRYLSIRALLLLLLSLGLLSLLLLLLLLCIWLLLSTGGARCLLLLRLLPLEKLLLILLLLLLLLLRPLPIVTTTLGRLWNIVLVYVDLVNSHTCHNNKNNTEKTVVKLSEAMR